MRAQGRLLLCLCTALLVASCGIRGSLQPPGPDQVAESGLHGEAP